MNSAARRRLLFTGLALLAAGAWFTHDPAPLESPAAPLVISDSAQWQPPVAAPVDRSKPQAQETLAATAAASPTAGTAAAQPHGERDFDAFNQWAQTYRAAAPDARPALIESGRQLAAQRRAALAELISANPRSAIEHAVPMVVRQDLPQEILSSLEERISAKAFYGVLGVVADPAAAAPTPPIRREVLLNGERYEAHVYGKRVLQKTTEDAHISGIALDRQMAVDERPLRVLEAGEIPGHGKTVFTTCPVSGKSVPVPEAEDGSLPPIDGETTAVEVAGEIHYLCSGGHIIQLEQGILAGEGVSGGATKPTSSITSTQSTGVRSLLYMRVAFPESGQSPQSETAAYDMMRQVNDFMVENSYGNVYIVTTVTPLLILPRTEAWYNNSGTNDVHYLRGDAQALAQKLGYDTTQYDLDIVVYSGGPGSFGGLGYVGSKGVWLKSITAGVACHELGHNFGLMHANFWDTGGKSSIGTGANNEYGNTYDTMGNAAAGDYHYNANHKNQLNWLPKANFVHQVTSSGTYRIFASDQPRLDPNNRYAIKVDKDSDREYWAEFRQKSFSSNKWVKDGIFLNWSPWVNSNGGAQLLDTTPGSPDDRTDAALVTGRTFSDYESGVHITPIGKGGTEPESMDVVVNVGTFPSNQAPVSTFTASSTAVGTNVAVTFTASASDPDGDPLAYAWDFGDKTFSTTNSATTSKSWATAGEYAVRCVVSDMKGKTSTSTTVVKVGSPTVYRISGAITLNGSPMANVRVSNGLTGSSYRGTFTDSDGTYTIANLAAATVTVTPAFDGYTFAASGFTNPVKVGPTVTGANFTATATNLVTLTVADGDCAEGAANPGKFTLTRTGSTAAALTVNFLTPSGSASRTADYALSPALVFVDPYYTAIIPAGQSSLDMVMTATADASSEGPETARLELAPGTGYSIGAAESASIEVQDANTTLPQLTIRVSDYSASEAGDTGAFTLNRTGSTAASLTARFTVTGSATAGSDYTSLGTSLVIPAGASSATLLVSPINDTAVEGSEDITVTLSSNAAYVLNSAVSPNAGTVTLVDDDMPSLTVTASDATASEAPGDTGTFLVTRTGPTTSSLTVNYALSGSALQGVDYVPLAGVLTIPAGASYGAVTIAPIVDGLGEPSQTAILQLRASPNYVCANPSIATVTITDATDLPVVSVAVTDGVAGEPSGTGKFTFTTTGTGSGNITVRYTVSGTATAGTDYTALTGTLTMARNTTASVTVTPLDDSELEDTETVTVTIDADPTYTSFLDASATLNLTDNDRPGVDIATVTDSTFATNDAFSENAGTGGFWISRSGSTTAALTVNYTLGGTATSGADYVTLPGSIDIPAGASGVLLGVTGIDDALKEGTESLVVTLAPGAYGAGSKPSATVYITDNDAPTITVRFSSSTGTGAESAGTVSIPVTLSAASAAPVSVEYLSSGGTALGGVDYTLARGTLTFAPGETSKTIPLTIVDDIYQESGQTVVVKLQNANGAALGTSTHTYTITDNDTAPVPTVAFAAAASTGQETVPTAPLIVSLSAPQSGTVSVAYAVTGGTATSGADYTLTAGTLTFAAGETAKVIPHTIIDDSLVESSETIIVTLSSPTGATLGSLVTHTYTITDEDSTAVSISASDASASEPGTDTGTFLVTRSGGTTGPVTVNLTYSGTATSGTDYQALPATVTIPIGSASAAVTLTPINDQLGEGSETVIATVQAGTGYGLGTPTSATVTIADDEPLISITASDASATEEGSNPGAFTITRTGSTTGSVSVAVVLGGTATSGTDYAAPTLPVVLAAGVSSAQLAITPIDDNTPEGPETIIATLQSGPYLISGPTAATVTLADDDVNNPPVITLLSPTTTSVAIPPDVGLVLDATASDDGRPIPPGLLTTTWTTVSGPGVVTFANASLPSTTASFSIPGTYVLRLTADDGGGAPATLDLTVTVSTAGIWTSQDIGAPAVAGSYTDADGTITLKGSGNNLDTTSDQFQFLYQSLTGDGEVRARVVSMSGGTTTAKVAVMLRNSTAANARCAFMLLFPTGSSKGTNSFRTRATDGADLPATNTAGSTSFPTWIRIVRSGSNFSGYVSTDGQTWTQVNATGSVTMDGTVLAGLAVSSNSTTALTTAVFDNITITNAPPNLGPDVSAGNLINATFPAPANLVGTVSDDAKPLPASVAMEWSKVSGPGTVSFSNATSAQTTVSFSQTGSYVLRLTADDGEVKTFSDVTVTSTLPTVTLSATISAASETGPVAGQFRVMRTGGTDAALTVRFASGSTAISGTDYTALGTSIVIPVGSSSATFDVVPLPDNLIEGSETVSATLTADAGYLIGAPSTASVSISDPPIDSWRTLKFGANAGNAAISGDTANPDQDSLNNLLEYALSGNPLAPDPALLPVLAKEGTDLTLTYKRPSSAPDVVYQVESWTAADGWTPAAFAEETLTDSAGVRTVKDRVPAGSASQMTLRLRVTRQ